MRRRSKTRKRSAGPGRSMSCFTAIVRRMRGCSNSNAWSSPRSSFMVTCARRLGNKIMRIKLIGAAVLLTSLLQAESPKGTFERIKVHGKALEGNLEGDSPDRDVFVYLPPSYASSPNRRYPVVYLLHGYGLTAERWLTFLDLGASADKNMAAGTVREMILVNPDAFTLYNGSMYSNSVTTGDWEGYIAEDLVGYI